MFFVLMIFFLYDTKAQLPQEDAALWTNMYLEKKIVKRFNVHLNQQVRFNNNISRFHFAYADVGLTYKVAKFMNATMDYVYIERHHISNKHNSEYFSTRHQFYFNLTFKYDINKFRLNYRTMVQAQIKDVYSSDN